MWENGQYEPIHPYLIPNILIPIWLEIKILFQEWQIFNKIGITNKNIHKTFKRYSENIGLEKEGYHDCSGDVGDEEVCHYVGGQLGMVFVTLEMGDTNHYLF